ncbi:SDR family oxidoreductase [Saccharopolyspora phatthalungensis]|uniref:NADP-dependent 3-hydroxy acid dehydrogenase YdfG n=1 Tax=Saccharopolyspora phatthalungensis TaxID=664693 RepID=A0A840QDL8_9PSEU|nr:SDR family NAD(P)-dependent oxidoreductase [Saccharopolyspora phatthalungensis]MBB5158874.1 NADP-dependent 3-hydroxy acid dehydrogenase YdfG [Saccharopolyspora phatthalungensis]
MELAKGNVAVVTGAANGIGRALASSLVERGIHVVLADIDDASLRRTAGELPGEVRSRVVDVSDLAQMEDLARFTLAEFDRVDLVINNAGITGIGAGPCWTVRPDDWDLAWSVNVGGVVNGIRAFVPHLVEADRGHVVNVASIAGLVTRPFVAAYTASKSAVVALSESLRGELSGIGSGVGVSVVCPGPVRTRFFEYLAAGPQGCPDYFARSNRLVATLPASLQAELGEAMVGAAASALAPQQAAQVIVDAVTADRFLILTDLDSGREVEQTWEKRLAEVRER